MKYFALIIAALALTSCASAASSPSLTPRQAFPLIRNCLVQRGVIVRHDSDPGGGFAYWGHVHSSHWGSWSYATQVPSNKIVSILTAASHLNAKQSRVFKYCTRWPR